MYRYDANTGGFPKLGDRVEVVNLGEEADGLKGTIGGWSDYAMLIALVALDKPMDDGRTIVGWPVVCLKPTSIINDLVKVQKRTFLEAFETIVEDDYQPAKKPSGNLCSESVVIDSDGFIIWEGGDRPVDGETVVAVKVRGKIPRSHIKAKYWPQITWRWRELGDPMNKWDIVAYKVVG